MPAFRKDKSHILKIIIICHQDSEKNECYLQLLNSCRMPMSKSILTISLLLTCWVGLAQGQPKLELEAYFSAIIVKDFDASIDWYSRVLGFELLDKTESDERGFKQANLIRKAILLELIELRNAVSLEEVLPNYTSRTRTLGIFKTGFIVAEFDKWMEHLRKEKVDFYGEVVRDNSSDTRMIIVLDPDGNRVQIFEK